MEAQRILITTDFSDASRPALSRGLDLARQFGAEAHVLHVVSTVDDTFVVPMLHVPVKKESSDEARAQAEAALRTLVEEMADSGQSVKLAVLESYYVPHGIVDYATGNGIELIVMGTQWSPRGAAFPAR